VEPFRRGFRQESVINAELSEHALPERGKEMEKGTNYKKKRVSAVSPTLREPLVPEVGIEPTWY